jgi:CheY-like chemotaxis protein
MFTFTLEVEKGDRGNRQDIVEKTENLSETIPLEILVVEDNQVNQKVVKKMLLRCGYKSDLAVDGLEAVKKCEQKDYGLILMDLQMPKMNGYDAASTILSREPDRYIVAMTANVLKADRERCAEIGMKDFLGKPFTLQELSGILKKLGEKAPS